MRFVLMLLLLASLALANQEMAFRVNQVTFPLNDFDQQFMASLEQYKRDLLISNEGNIPLEELERLKYGVLDTLIDQAIILDYSKSQKISIPTEKIKARYLALQKAYTSPVAFQENLKAQGIRASQLMESLRFQSIKDEIAMRTMKDISVITQDILLYIRQKNIAMFPIHYDLTLVVTDNRVLLDSLRVKDLRDWANLNINTEYSSQNMLVADADLDLAMQSFLDTLEVNVLSSTCPYDDTNYYRVRINQVHATIPPHLRSMVDGIRGAVQEEKKIQRFKEWLDEQRRRTSIKVNLRAFPYFYHRDRLHGTL